MSIFDRIPSVDELDLTDEYAPTVKNTTKNQIGRGIASINDPSEANSLKSAFDTTTVGKQESRRPRKIDKQTLEERRELRRFKQQEQRFKLLSDLAEVQKGIGEINQARLDFYQMSSQAELNKELIDQEIDEIAGAGQAQAGLERAKGETRSELAQLKLAAQGQNLSGEGAKAVSRSSKIMASVRAADARSNALSRALGLDFEKTAMDRQVAYGAIQRDQAYLGGASRAAFGIADAFVRYKGTNSTTDTFKKDTYTKKWNLSDYIKGSGRGPANIKYKKHTFGFE